MPKIETRPIRRLSTHCSLLILSQYQASYSVFVTSVESLAVEGRIIYYYKLSNEINDSLWVADIENCIIFVESFYSECEIQL